MAAPAEFGAPRLLLTDARLAVAVLNHGRYLVLRSVFGVSREQANLLTAVLALAAADAAYVAARRIVHVPHGLTANQAGTGAILAREAVLGVSGPESRAVPLFAASVAVALLGRRAVPAVGDAVRGLRRAEQRVRVRRIGRYLATVARSETRVSD